jgi:predicted RecA/RadA family phage recombinase
MKHNKKLVEKIREIIEQEMSKRRDPLEIILNRVNKANYLADFLDMVEGADHYEDIKDYFNEIPGGYKKFVDSINDVTGNYIETIDVKDTKSIKSYISAYDISNPMNEKMFCKSGDVIKIGAQIAIINYIVKLHERGENIDDGLYRGMKIYASGIEKIIVYKKDYHPKTKISQEDKDDISGIITRFMEKKYGGDVDI